MIGQLSDELKVGSSESWSDCQQRRLGWIQRPLWPFQVSSQSSGRGPVISQCSPVSRIVSVPWHNPTICGANVANKWVNGLLAPVPNTMDQCHRRITVSHITTRQWLICKARREHGASGSPGLQRPSCSLPQQLGLHRPDPCCTLPSRHAATTRNARRDKKNR